MRKLWWVVALLCAGACKKDDKPATGPTPPTEAPKPALQPVGMADPFARMPPDAGKALERGWKAARAKKWDDAQREFKAAVAQAPDHPAARWALLRAQILGGAFADVPATYEGLIARDYVGYAARLDKGKELDAFRKAPEWTKVGELRARYRDGFAAGLDKGFFFVARTRAAEEPKLDVTVQEAPLELRQEAFHYDLAGKRFRRVTDTDGHVFAIDRIGDGKTLAFLVAPRLHREKNLDSFVDPKVGVLDLVTLETVGPFAQKGRFDQVMLGANKAGQPLFTFVAGSTIATLTFDTAKTGLAKIEGDAALPAGGETHAWPNQVAHSDGKTVEGVTITDGATQFTVAGVAAPIVAARPLAQSSIEWSPGKTRLTYAGKLDACRILKGGGNDKNELYVYDVPKKAAQRVAAAVSAFETSWLDDDHLVYEGGVGKDGQIHLYAFTAHADSSLPTRHGAGLYGVPTLACELAETGVDEDLGEEGDGEGD